MFWRDLRRGIKCHPPNQTFQNIGGPTTAIPLNAIEYPNGSKSHITNEVTAPIGIAAAETKKLNPMPTVNISGLSSLSE